MHLVIELGAAPLPALQRQALVEALRKAQPLHAQRLDPLDPHTPLERLLGRLRGLPDDAALPLAAWRLDEQRLPWAFLSPVHLQFDATQVIALPVQLQPEESQRLWGLLAPLFPDSEGWQRAWLDAHTWAVAHEPLQGLRLASLNRAVDRPLTPWLPEDRRIRRWTNEAQMLLHSEPAPAQGLKPNSIWWWGAGRHAGEALPEGVQIIGPGQPWPALPPQGLLSLAGEQGHASFRLGARPAWQFWRPKVDLDALLERLC